MLEIGCAVADITAFKKGIGMMGYGQADNIVEELETPLSARAIVLKNPETLKKIVFVNAEICFITIAIKSVVVKRLQELYPALGYTLENVVLTAQHTHSAPGGYSHYPFYNFTIPGFVPEVFNTVVNGIISAIAMAEKSCTGGTIALKKGIFESNSEIAFNRSIEAYNLNPEVQKISANQTHLAVDREMTLLKIDKQNGDPMAMINWFGVHTTSVPNDNRKICFDNKGYAAAHFEGELRKINKDFVGIFAQNICGDVSPNFIWDHKKSRMRGKFEDGIKSAQYNGKLQYLKAKEIFESPTAFSLSDAIDFVHTYVDFSNVSPDKEFTGGQKVSTSSACHGVSFFEGTAEGPGMSKILGSLTRFLSRRVKKKELKLANTLSSNESAEILKKYSSQGKKDILFETGKARVLGITNISKLPIPTWVEKSVKAFKQQYADGALRAPWVPQILPLQLVIVGELAIASLPGEITTVAGKRLKDTIFKVLEKRGVKEVIISSYANAYCGYITTYEEYQHQSYEGGHTIYGEWTLAAFQTKFKELAMQLLEKPENRTFDNSVQPFEFTHEELDKRTLK